MQAVMRRIIRRRELKSVTGYGLSTLYEMMVRGEFPKPIPLGKRAVGWVEDEIAAWQAERVKARETARRA